MSSDIEEHYQAIVVGGGPAGALLAYLLAKYGVKVLLIERQNDFAREFRGEGLSPSGQAMFDEAGLWEEFDKVPHTSFEQAKIYFKGRLVSNFSMNWAGQQYRPRFVSQPAMLEMLITEASGFDSFSFLRGERVLGPLTQEGRVVGVEVREGEQTRAIRADYVFAADGRFSTMRKACGLDKPRSPQAFDVIWCKIPKPEFMKDEAVTVRGYFGNGHLGLFIPSHDGLLQVGWIIPKGSYKDFREMGIEGWLNEMGKHLDPPMTEHLSANEDKALHPFLLDVVCDHYPDWSVPGMTILGDAAHPMSPVGAQGINIALRDSVVAANHFVPLLRANASPQALDQAALDFAKERRVEVLKIQKMQARPPIVLLGKGYWIDILVSFTVALARTGLFAMLTRFANPAKNPFANGVTEVKLKL